MEDPAAPLHATEKNPKASNKKKERVRKEKSTDYDPSSGPSFRLPLSPRAFLPTSPRTKQMIRQPAPQILEMQDAFRGGDPTHGQEERKRKRKHQDNEKGLLFQPNFKNEAETLRLAVSKEVQKIGLLEDQLLRLHKTMRHIYRAHMRHLHSLQELAGVVHSLPHKPIAEATPVASIIGKDPLEEALALADSLVKSFEEEGTTLYNLCNQEDYSDMLLMSRLQQPNTPSTDFHHTGNKGKEDAGHEQQNDLTTSDIQIQGHDAGDRGSKAEGDFIGNDSSGDSDLAVADIEPDEDSDDSEEDDGTGRPHDERLPEPTSPYEIIAIPQGSPRNIGYTHLRGEKSTPKEDDPIHQRYPIPQVSYKAISPTPYTTSSGYGQQPWYLDKQDVAKGPFAALDNSGADRAPLKYPRQIPGFSAELPRLVPHIARQMSDESSNLRRKLRFRHMTRHLDAKHQLLVFLQQRDTHNPRDELLQQILSSHNEAVPESQPTARHPPAMSGEKPRANVGGRSSGKSYLKNYLAQKALREERDKQRMLGVKDGGCSPLMGDAEQSGQATQCESARVKGSSVNAESTTPSPVEPDSDHIGSYNAQVDPLRLEEHTQDQIGNVFDRPIHEHDVPAVSDDKSDSDECLSGADDMGSEAHSYSTIAAQDEQYAVPPAHEFGACSSEGTHPPLQTTLPQTDPILEKDKYIMLLSHFITSERSYTQSMDDIIALLNTLASADRMGIPHPSLLKLASYAELIRAISLELVERIEERRQAPTEAQDVGKLILGMLEHFLVYKDYSHCLHHLATSMITQVHKPNPSSRQPEQFPRELAKRLEEPLQRLFAYSNLFEAITRTMVQGHSHCRNLYHVAIAIRKLSYDIGYLQLPSSRQIALRQLQQMLAWPDGEPMMLLGHKNRRQVVRIGTFTKLSGKGEVIARRLVLFSDLCLICTELKSQECLLRTVIPMHLSLVIDNGETSNSFSIVRRDTNEGGLFTAPSREDKDKWLDDLHAVALQCVALDKNE